MSAIIISLADQRLIRRMPQTPLALCEDDLAYVGRCLDDIAESFGTAVRPAVPLEMLPGRSLMRLLVSLRRDLRPANAEQRAARGALASAILRLDTAAALAEERIGARWGGQ